MGDSPDSDSNHAVIDLTEAPEAPINPLCPSPPHNRRKRRHGDRGSAGSTPRNEDEDIEVVSVTQNEPIQVSTRRRRLRRVSNGDDGLDVVDEKRLTPQERLRRVQEQHARGEVVQTNQAQGNVQPVPFNSFGAYHMARGGPRLMAPHAFHSYIQMLPEFRNAMPWHAMPFSEMYGPGHGRPGMEYNSLEHRIMEETLQASMTDTRRQKVIDVKSLNVPEAPTTSRPGFIRTLATDSELVCVKCNHPLGKPDTELTSSANMQSQKVFARGCGHVYCGKCTFAMRDRATKDKACPVAECKKLSPRARGLFREVFM